MATDGVTFPVYMDNQSTTRVDPRVVQAMLPCWTENYGNAGSLHHALGEAAKNAIEESRAKIARSIGAQAEEVIFTSGATESNNLAIRGVSLHPRNRRRHLVSALTEHHATLTPLRRLQQSGFDLTLLSVLPAGHAEAGRIELQQAEEAITDQTGLVSLMLANNEIGVIQPVSQIAHLAHQQGALVHCDATQAVGKMNLNVQDLGVDLMSFTAHKMYGPKGVGALYIRGGRPTVKLLPQIEGGGQEGGFRSGTLNVPGVVGFAEALTISLQELTAEQARLRQLRGQLWKGLRRDMPELTLNGPDVERDEMRLPGNLNCSFPGFDGQTLQLNMPQLAISSGAACSSSQPEPSHVLGALGIDEDAIRSSLRFGLGRFNTSAEVEFACQHISDAMDRIKSML